MVNLDSFKRDSSRVEAGEWVDGLPRNPEVRFRVRGLQSMAFAEAQAKLQRQVPAHKRAVDGSIETALSYALLGKALHEAVLLEWDNLRDDKTGEIIPYDADLAITLLTNPDFQDFAETVMAAAQVVDRRARSVDAGQAEKN